jgi:serine/threonine protein kinase
MKPSSLALRDAARSQSATGPSRELDDLVAELTDRLQAGEPVDVEAYLAAHPEHAERLRQVLPALEMMAALGDPSHAPLSATLSGPSRPLDGLAPELGELGDYRILRELGRGGMGVVYEATQVSLDRRVALKVLPFAAALDAHQLQRFKTEAQAAAQLHHTNIVPVFSIGCERGVHYYAMQFIEGRTLAALIQEQRQWEQGGTGDAPTVSATPGGAASASKSSRDRGYIRNVAELGIQAAEALDYAHKLGIIHRDIKPANLLLDVRGNLWVTDFGQARFQDDAGVTMTGDLLGTLRYMSPEQALAQRAIVDHRTDIYSLGVTLYELATLRPAIEGTDRRELLRRIAEDEPVSARSLNPAIPRELETILLKAINKEVAGRYATARELAEDLRRFLEDKPIKAKRPTALEHVWKWVRRHPSTVIATLVTLTITTTILTAAIILITREQVRTQDALLRARNEQEIATRYAVNVQRQSERAYARFNVVLQDLRSLLLRLGDKTVPDAPEVEDLRRSIWEDARRTSEEFIDGSSVDPQVLSESVIACTNLAELYFVSAPGEEAFKVFSRAIRLSERLMAVDPSNPDYITKLADCRNLFGLRLYAVGSRFRAIDQLVQARRLYLRAFQQDPQRLETLRRLRWFLAICPEACFRDPDRVIQLTAKMIEQEEEFGAPQPWDPTRSPHWLLRSIAFYRKGDFASAIGALEGPLEVQRPRSGSLYGSGDTALGWFVLAMAYRRAGDCARAMRSYRIATRVMDTTRPRDGELMIFRAETEALLGIAEPPVNRPEKEVKRPAQG